MSDLGQFVFGAAVLYELATISHRLKKLTEQAGLIEDHLRIIRQYDLESIQRNQGALIEGIHDPHWKRYSS